MTEDELNQWCHQTFSSLHEGDILVVPRSGVAFQRCGDRLVFLTATVPWDPAMPCTEAELREQQESEFHMAVEYFGRAGIKVEREQ